MTKELVSLFRVRGRVKDTRDFPIEEILPTANRQGIMYINMYLKFIKILQYPYT